ncbi:fungal-specific transcription factor domain-containing protein [Kalaharituber pfeilii]|nr:fungal-specific transcription factor domain-containing protein [Kalaharituber pfeilii]
MKSTPHGPRFAEFGAFLLRLLTWLITGLQEHVIAKLRSLYTENISFWLVLKISRGVGITCYQGSNIPLIPSFEVVVLYPAFRLFGRLQFKIVYPAVLLHYRKVLDHLCIFQRHFYAWNSISQKFCGRRGVHETKRSDVRRSRRRSCRRCAGFKIKCSGGSRGSADGSRGDEACEACKKRGVACVYDFGVHTDGIATREDAGKHSCAGSGDDDMLDDLSEEERTEYNGGRERLNKRRKISEDISDKGSSTAVGGTVSHLLSAALMASPSSPQRNSGDVGADDDSCNAATTVASLVHSTGTSGQRTPEIVSADQLLSMVTSRTYEESAGKTISPRSTYTNGDRASYLPQPQFCTPRISSSQIRKSPVSDFTQEPLSNFPQSRSSLNPSQFIAALTQQATTSSPQQSLRPNNSSGVGACSLSDSYNSTRSPKSGMRCVGNASGLPGILPPPSLNMAMDCTSSNSPKMFSNVLLGAGENKRDEMISDSIPLESDDNWFFDAGIFETDWLRWGGLSTDAQAAPELEQILTGLERHMSTCSNDSVSGHVPTLTNSRTVSGATSKDQTSPTSTPSEYSAYPPNSKEVRLPSVSPIKDSSAVDDFLPWGWQASREEPKKRITLPPLRQVLQACSPQRIEHSSTAFGSRFNFSDSKPLANWIGAVNDNIRNDLISVLKVPYARHPYCDDCDIESKFPSKELIDGFILLYFKHFHSVLPMIHRPTFRVENCPSILLVAMASIGASYSDIEGAKGFADGLSELCKRALTWMAEYDNGYLRSEYYLTAFCLQHAYALGSGHQALYDAADSTRSFLVANARRCGLFSDTTSPCTRPPSPPSSPKGNVVCDELGFTRSNDAQANVDEHHLQARWLAWCEQEKRKRVAWAIFSYDSSFSTLSNRRGDISLNDIKARLPCEEKMWEAPTALAWAAMLPPASAPNASLAFRGMPFYPTLRDVISGKLAPKEIPSWGKELCAWALGRLLWDFKEMEQTALGCGVNGLGGLGLPALTEGLKRTKETALAALTALGEAAWESEDGECDKVHSNLTSLIVHYSHLHFGVPTISIILSLARNPPSSPCMNNKSTSETVEDCRITRLRSIFTEDPVHARTIAWHAGQIIGISRLHPVHTPAETMRVFLAGVVLWGVAKWFVECRSMAAADTWTCGLNDAANVRLDAIPTPACASGAMPPEVAEWLKTGKGRATIRKDGDGRDVGETQLCSEQGAKEVLQVVISILGKMRIWGLGAEFRRVLEVMGK